MPLSEFQLIQRYFASLDSAPQVALGVGDDCALLELPPGEQLATSIDTMVSGVHFPEDARPEDLAWRAVAAAASDLAAMGADPLGMTLALTLPDANERWLQGFAEGLAKVAEVFALPLVGGDTTRGPLAVAVQVMGSLPAGSALLRSGAAAGDRLCISGTPGDAAAGLALLQGRWQPPQEFEDYLRQRFYRPVPRITLGRSLREIASAAIDVSDGLLADAGHIAYSSGVRLAIDAALVPLSPALAAAAGGQALQWALAGGDDYELLFTLPAGVALPAQCTVIGAVTSGDGVDCLDSPGIATGYEHFRSGGQPV